MKIIKYLLFLFLIAFIAGSIYIATKDGDYQVEESRIILAPPPLLFNEVNEYTNWEAWSWTHQQDISLSYTKETKGEGAGFSWENGDIPDGSLRTTELLPFSRIRQQLVLHTTVTEADSEVYWEFEPLDEGTRVTWGMKGNQNFKEKLALALQDREMAEIFRPLFDQGLEDLERTITNKMEEFSISVDGTTRHGGGYYMYTTTATRISEVHEKGADMIQQVTEYMQTNNISINGKPFILYNQRDEENGTTIFSAAVPTPSQVVTPSGSPVLTGYLPSQRVVKTTLKGNHKNVSQAWDTAYNYIQENDLELDPDGEAFEIYITNPADEQNPALWITEIYIPVLE